MVDDVWKGNHVAPGEIFQRLGFVGKRGDEELTESGCGRL